MWYLKNLKEYGGVFGDWFNALLYRELYNYHNTVNCKCVERFPWLNFHKFNPMKDLQENFHGA